MKSRTITGLWVVVSLLTVGCGGSQPEAEDASNVASDDSKKSDGDEGDKSGSAKGSDEGTDSSGGDDSKKNGDDKKDDDSKKGSDDKKDDAAGPNFPENASVAQAIAAIPKGTQRSNIDPETLGEPLNKPEVYEPCKPGSQHFTIKVAVWDGKAVGIDVTTNNKALAECVKKQIQAIEWRDKVKSLNTVEYKM